MSDRPSVLFVCVHNAGRSQMAAALLSQLSGGAVEVRSAGSQPADQVNPAAVAAMAELGIDIAAETPKLLTDEAVRESDVVVTMGCGDTCPFYPGLRYEDWQLDDPAGQGIDAVRPIRDEIRTRVERLVAELVPQRPDHGSEQTNDSPEEFEMAETTAAPLLVTGGTGTLGRALIAQLEKEGTDFRVLSRRPGPGHVVADLSTGAGLEGALTGVRTVINCATSPGHDAPAAYRLLEEARRQGIEHLVHVSIVGIDKIPLSYYREKLAVESLVAGSGVPNTVLRATQFHNLLASLFATLSRSPVLPLPGRTSFQPVDVCDVAARLTSLAQAGPAGRVADLGGPEIRDVRDLARSWLTAASRFRLVVGVPLPGRLARAFRAGLNCTPEHADGRITFEEFLRGQPFAKTR